MIFPSDSGFVFTSGLDATGPFFSRYGASLKELDFSIMTFLWNEKYGHKLGSIEGKQLDYFYEPTSLKEARCLIWLLEEHRDKFPALHNALDEFFDIMGMWTEFQFNLRKKSTKDPSLFQYLKKIVKIIMMQPAYLERLGIKNSDFFHLIKPFYSVELSVVEIHRWVCYTDYTP